MHPEVKQARRHSFLSASHWPSAVGDKGASAKKVFAKKMSEFKSSASEAMALYPVMRAFLQEKLPNIRDHECRECCRCFFILCEVLDLLYETAAPQDPSTQAAALEQKIAAHMELFKRCYGVEKVIPKAHRNMHLGTCCGVMACSSRASCTRGGTRRLRDTRITSTPCRQDPKSTFSNWNWRNT